MNFQYKKKKKIVSLRNNEVERDIELMKKVSLFFNNRSL